MKELVNVTTNAFFLQNEKENNFHLTGCIEIVLIYTDGKDYNVSPDGKLKSKMKLTETRLIASGEMMQELITGLQLHHQKLLSGQKFAYEINALAKYTDNTDNEKL